MPMISPAEFERLVSRSLPTASALAVRLCGDLQQAEDVLAEALLRASRSYHTFRGDSAFSTWLTRIVINAFRDSLRRHRSDGTAFAADPVDDAPGPAALAAGDEISRIVALHVSALPPRQREALVLTVYEGLSAPEAAAVLETTPEYVRTLAMLARRRLAIQLAHLAPERRHVQPH